MTCAHAGVAVLIAGITASSAWTVERIQTMRPGETVPLGGYEVTFDGVREGRGPNYIALAADFTVRRDGALVGVLSPEKRSYPVEGQPTTEAAIRSGVLGDLYAVIGDPDGDGSYVTRLYFNPLVPWIWAGVLAMTLGGLISLTDRRHRVGAPAARAAAAAVPARA